MLMADSPQFVVVYLAAMRMGAVPVPVSTMLKADGVAELLRDSRARFLAVTREFAATAVAAAAAAPELTGMLADEALTGGQPGPGAPARRAGRRPARRRGLPDHRRLARVLAVHLGHDRPAQGARCTGTGPSRWSARPTAPRCSGSRPGDRCLSAAKAFFAYGLGNSLLFPLSVGASAVLVPAPSRPDLIAGRGPKYGATLFFAGPTFFANMLRAGLPADALAGVRLAASAGEALPASLYQRWTSHFGVDILDGIGMTEMLHIFLSNRPGQVRAGTTGVAVPGYDLRVLDEAGHEVPPRHAGHPVRPRRLPRHRVLVPVRRLAPGLPG